MRAGATLRDKALYALEEIVHQCRYGKPSQTFAVRFVLAYLWSLDRGDIVPYRELWCAMTSFNDLTRYSAADRALAEIHTRLGAPRDEEQYWAMWAHAQEEHKRQLKDG